MASCPACGSEITPAMTAGGESIALEKYTDTTGDGRYRILEAKPGELRAHLTVEKVAPSSTMAAYPDHRLDCPAFGNGRRA